MRIVDCDIEKTKRLIKEFEGFSRRVYKCPAGLDTIGYGHVLKSYEFYLSVTEEEADELLERDIDVIRNRLDFFIPADATEGQCIALTSLAFNVGCTAVLRSKLMKKLRLGDAEGAAIEFLDWDYCNGKRLPGLTRRRNKEHDVFTGKEQL